MITKDVLKKYGLLSIDEYKELMQDPNSEELYYRTFLSQTDHIPNKIVEAQFLSRAVDDYTEILEAREFARSEINRITSSI